MIVRIYAEKGFIRIVPTKETNSLTLFYSSHPFRVMQK